MQYSFLVLFSLMILPPLTSTAQKSKCLAGNCRNGFGFKQVTESKSWIKIYEMGTFKNGDLSGKGCRFGPKWPGTPNYSAVENEMKQLVKDKTLPTLVLNKYNWFEQGNYENGQLNGKGNKTEYKEGGGLLKQIIDGNFKDGLLDGSGIKIKYSPDWYIKYDSVTNNKIYYVEEQGAYVGIFEKGFCLECTRSTYYKNSNGEIDTFRITGKKIDEDFINGWVIKDYQGEIYISKRKKVKPYRALYVGGLEIGSIEDISKPTAIKKISIDYNYTFTGPVDENSNPSGFGIIENSAGDNIYEGMVQDGKPNGFGLTFTYYSSGGLVNVLGGYYLNNKIMYGAFYQTSTLSPSILRFGTYPVQSDPKFDAFWAKNLEGPYEKYTYSYDKIKSTWSESRVESGYRINGNEESKNVSKGATAEEIRKQRVVSNGRIAFNTVLVGDVVVLDGLASPVAGIDYKGLTLIDGRVIPQNFNQQIQLSRHQLSEFQHTCSKCKGKPFYKEMYTPPTQVVTGTAYRTEIYKGDYYSGTISVPYSYTYEKKGIPIERSAMCRVCDGSGVEKIAMQIKE